MENKEQEHFLCITAFYCFYDTPKNIYASKAFYKVELGTSLFDEYYYFCYLFYVFLYSLFVNLSLLINILFLTILCRKCHGHCFILDARVYIFCKRV